MANQEHVERLKQGVVQWNAWRKTHWKKRWPDLSRADLGRANLNGVNLRSVSLNGADLVQANLSGADLCYANLDGSDLRYANLGGADLHYASLVQANLSGANLNKANLVRTNLSGANLNEANLGGANLNGADLSEANLNGADMNRANLLYADLGGTDLGGADLSKALLGKTVFVDNDLRAVRGLLEINHRGLSYVALHNVKLPQDGSALHFLRGVGIPNAWIDLYRTSMMMPIQYHSVFISYSSQDDMLARRLHADLQDYGVRCWFAPEDMKIGDKIRSRIDEAIHLQDKLLLLLSEHSLASSWVEDEVEAALEKERRRQREVLFPIRLDENVMHATQSWAAKLRRTRHIGNFTYWTEPQEYQKAFERLLRDLKAQS